jgi:hypothetical protein
VIDDSLNLNAELGGPRKRRPRRGSRARGTNPRALGTNPRAAGTNPRALFGVRDLEQDERRLADVELGRKLGWLR